MNYHLENIQGQRNAADGIVSLVKDIMKQVSPEQYHIDGAAEDIKKLEDKCDELERQVKSLTDQLEEAGIAVEAIE
mgnify:CR=1 FL=1